MDFQGFVNTFSSSCAVLSVKTGAKGHASEIRIVKANDFYKGTMGVARYRDDMLYSEMVPKDNKFEDFCYRCAIKKQKFHYYIELKSLHCWTEINLMPLEGGNDELGYLAFFFEATKFVSPEKLSDVTPETASSVIKTCVTLRGAEDFNASINSVITEIQQKASAYCCCIILLDKYNQTYEVLAEKFRSEFDFRNDLQIFLPYEVVKTWESTIGGSNGIIVKDEQDMQLLEKQNPGWVESLRIAYVKNLLLYPIKQGKNIIGYLFVTNFDTENLVKIKELVELTAFFLSSEIANHILIEKLDYLSNTDLLTGVKNRNAMNTRVDMFVRGEELIQSPFGVVFADLNGLKQANDKFGHVAGDKMIKQAALIIKSIFTDSEIYRAGGDEFVIIMPACSKEEFEEKIKLLKDKTVCGSEVCLAIGSHWDENGENLRLAMHLADEQMYQDKELFYSSQKDLTRRT